MRSITQVLIVGTVCLCSTHAFAQGTPSPTRTPDAPAQQLRRDLETHEGTNAADAGQNPATGRSHRETQYPGGCPRCCLRPLHLYLRPLPRATENNSSRRSERRSYATFSRNSLQANKTFPSQFNPAITLAIDSMFAYRQHEGNNFEFRSAELGLSASVDPFVRGYAFFNGTSDDFEVEEAAIVTTSLPFNLAVKGGRFFADFGRLAKFHEHDLPFVNRPVVLERFVGGESQADGFEVSYLLPIEHYVTLTAGMYNKLGAENDRVSNEVPRDLGQFTYLGRVATFISLSDAHSVDLGASYAYTPQVADRGEGASASGRSGHYVPLCPAQPGRLPWSRLGYGSVLQ